MPANKKYLTTSPWLRFSKIMAGAAGGYAVMLSLHLLLTTVFPRENVLATAFFTGYILWAFLLLWAFVARNVWHVWLTYLGLTLLFAVPYLLMQPA
ncbi:hypothetical protein J7E24_16680 [Hymenobacter sp. ISL-91]|uniref:hypothetical protein n=1 Tax=Hymenobacter sp. ISL-91 TaxID=2819151 RepID=UPI001BE50BEE|nr:hypothetical protein [Hymenobacter sp. ISL-91]MBT2559425.1 hypothetical protein [Hymenobacter sp. ISL-91]